jgi:hypothetical protein
MPRGSLLDLLPPWMIFVGTAALILLSIYGGIFLAHFRRKRSITDQGTSVSAIVAATTALLAFLLAFTFGLAASRFDTRRALLLDEINAIETTFLRTGLIPEPHGAAVRALLKEYVDIRVELARHPENMEQLIRRSEQLQGLMWPHAEALAEADLRNSPIVSLFVDSLNQMFDMQTKRITVGAFYRMPTVMWIALFALTILSMLELGYFLGMFDCANWLLVLMLSLALSTVILLIADLDRTGARGTALIKVELQPMIDLQQRIAAQMTFSSTGIRVSYSSKSVANGGFAPVPLKKVKEQRVSWSPGQHEIRS